MNIRVITQPVRGCGLRKVLGLYLVSMEGSDDGALPHYVVVDSPIPVQRKPHRTPVAVDGDKVLRREPEDTWLTGTSERTAEKKRGEALEIETFGIPLNKRLAVGCCIGLTDQEECIERILGSLTWSPQVVGIIRQMSKAGVANMPDVSTDFAELIKASQMFLLEDRKASHLMTIAARAWSMAMSATKRTAPTVVPLAADILSVIGLGLDSVAVRLLRRDISLDTINFNAI